MSDSVDSERAPRQVPWGVLSAFVLLAGCFLVMLGIIVLDNSTSTGELLALIGVIVLVIGMISLGAYLHSVRPRRD